jgi:hypothetical protein
VQPTKIQQWNDDIHCFKSVCYDRDRNKGRRDSFGSVDNSSHPSRRCLAGQTGNQEQRVILNEISNIRNGVRTHRKRHYDEGIRSHSATPRHRRGSTPPGSSCTHSSPSPHTDLDLVDSLAAMLARIEDRIENVDELIRQGAAVPQCQRHEKFKPIINYNPLFCAHTRRYISPVRSSVRSLSGAVPLSTASKIANTHSHMDNRHEGCPRVKISKSQSESHGRSSQFKGDVRNDQHNSNNVNWLSDIRFNEQIGA